MPVVVRAVVGDAAPESGKSIKGCLQMLASCWERVTSRCSCRNRGSRRERLSERLIFSSRVKVNFFCVEPFQMLSDDFEDGVTGFEPFGIVVLFFADSGWPAV